MNFQTIFYLKESGKIIHIEPNRYIRSKYDKARCCPNYTADEINFMYFKSSFPIDINTHRVRLGHNSTPPVVLDPDDLPLVYSEKRQLFREAIARYHNIILDFADSMGDNLFRAAAVLEAQKKYPNIKFYCKIWPEYRDVISMIPGLTIFNSYAAHGLKQQECGHISMNGGLVFDPRGEGFSKTSLYGLFLDLSYAEGTAKISLPQDFDQQHAAFGASIGLRDDGHNIVFQVRTKGFEDRSWDNDKAAELAEMIKQAYDCNIYYVGTPLDLSGELPNIINLAGKTTWLQTIYLLRKCSHIVCIDSAIMNLCRSLDLPYTCLWGLTHPWRTLACRPQPYDIVLPNAPSSTAIKSITPAMVFRTMFRDTKHDDLLIYERDKDYSQHGTQKIIFDYFNAHKPANKILVDVGAFGRDMSNTYALLTLGWKGLLIEANPERVRATKKEFHGLNADILNMAISDEEGEAQLHIHSELGHDSLDPEWFPYDLTEKTITVKTSTLEKILKQKKIPENFDLLSVDTEGWDERIITHLLNNSSYRPRLIVTESTSYADADALFTQHGYKFIALCGDQKYGNLIYAIAEG